jgi:hypothetical protein
LPRGLNFLVGEYNPPEAGADRLTEPTAQTPTCLHYTLGVGVFAAPTQDYVPLWMAARRRYEKALDHERAAGIH